MKKGEKGIRILAPTVGTKRKKESEAEEDIIKQNQPVSVGFRAIYVLDVSQTECADLPDLTERVDEPFVSTAKGSSTLLLLRASSLHSKSQSPPRSAWL